MKNLKKKFQSLSLKWKISVVIISIIIVILAIVSFVVNLYTKNVVFEQVNNQINTINEYQTNSITNFTSRIQNKVEPVLDNGTINSYINMANGFEKTDLSEDAKLNTDSGGLTFKGLLFQDSFMYNSGNILKEKLEEIEGAQLGYITTVEGIVIADSRINSLSQRKRAKEYIGKQLSTKDYKDIEFGNLKYINGKPRLLLSTPIYKSGSQKDIMGYSVIGISLDLFKNNLKTSLGKYGSASLINKEGNILNHKNKNLLTQNLEDKWYLEQISNSNKETTSTKKVVNGSYKSINKIPGTELYLIGDIPISEIEDSVVKIRNIIIVIALLGILLGIAIVLYFVRYITDPIIESNKFAREIANGNLNSPKLEVNDEGDEIDELSSSLNEMQDNLQDTIVRILEVTRDLSSYEQKIIEVDGKIHYAFEFIQDVKIGNEETANSVDEISLSLSEIAKGTEALAIKAEDISKLGDETFSVVRKTDDKINSGSQLVNQAVDVMKELRTSVNQVDQISENIMGIAEQTNLLSLDGAIEAADGEGSGGGFGAIADDIKDLADESMESAKEVKQIVADVKDVTDRAINIMIPAQSSDQNIADIFDELEALSNDLVVKIDKVTDATADQVASTEEISASTEEISAASEEVSGQADEMYQNAKELEEIMREIAEFNENLGQQFKEQTKKSEEQLEAINVDL
ncbi:MAG: methyl-accepting chemotaxis protein [Bacillota bacterium]